LNKNSKISKAIESQKIKTLREPQKSVKDIIKHKKTGIRHLINPKKAIKEYGEPEQDTINRLNQQLNEKKPKNVMFVGSQYLKDHKELEKRNEIFRDTINNIDKVLTKKQAKTSIFAIIYNYIRNILARILK